MGERCSDRGVSSLSSDLMVHAPFRRREKPRSCRPIASLLEAGRGSCRPIAFAA